MFETLKVILTESKRSLFSKFKTSPILYLFFSAMVFFSVIMFAFLTYILLKTEVETTLQDVFFGIFFILLLKSAADFHTYYIKSPQISYPLSTQANQTKTIFEIFLAILLVQLALWFSFSGLYLLTLFALRIDIWYPLEYLSFSIGVILATLLGNTISLHFFSPKRYRLIPAIMILAYYWLTKDFIIISLTLPIVLLYFVLSIENGLTSYLFVNRKERIKEKDIVRKRDVVNALFHREITILWRDRILFSFLFTAIITAIGTGYFVLYGTDILIPVSIREMAEEFLPSMFVFLGIYVVTIYTSVFPGLNLFLNEEKTMWILRNLPVKNETIVCGKALSLAPCFLTAVPFLAYITIFIGSEDLVFLTWFLSFSFIAGVIISVPLGAKYVGKKSDVLLLYSVAMILFLLLGCVGVVGNFVRLYTNYVYIFYFVVLLIECLFLYLSLKLSTHILITAMRK